MWQLTRKADPTPNPSGHYREDTGEGLEPENEHGVCFSVYLFIYLLFGSDLSDTMNLEFKTEMLQLCHYALSSTLRTHLDGVEA